MLCEDGRQELCLHVTEDFYHRLWAQAAVGLATLDFDTGHIQQCNDHFAHMLGFPAGALVGRRLTQLLHGDDQAANEALLTGLAEGKRDRYELECLAYRQGGTLACVHLIVSSIRDAAGTPICTMAVTHDVTAQRQEEKRLQAAEGRFRLLFEQNVAGMLRTTVAGQILECNEAFARMLGYGYPAQVLEHRAEDLFPAAENRAAFIVELQQLVRLRNHEVELLRRDGSTLWCLLNATLAPDPEGNLTIVEGSAVDITDRKRAEEQLRIQRDLAHALAAVTNIEDAAQVCIDAATRASGMEAGGFYILDSSTNCLNLAAWQGVSDEFARSVAVIAPGDPRHQTVSDGQCVFARLRDLPGSEESLRVDQGLRAVAVVPIIHQGVVVGCFNLATRLTDEVSRTRRESIEVVATLVGNAILRIRAESTVRQREAELATLFDSLRDLVLVLDTDGIVLNANRGACANLGFTPDELVGRHVRDLHPPELRDDIDSRPRLVGARPHDDLRSSSGHQGRHGGASRNDRGQGHLGQPPGSLRGEPRHQRARAQPGAHRRALQTGGRGSTRRRSGPRVQQPPPGHARARGAAAVARRRPRVQQAPRIRSRAADPTGRPVGQEAAGVLPARPGRT